RNHRLCGKILQQRDFLFRERAYFTPRGSDLAKQFVVFAQRYTEQCPSSADLGSAARDRIVDLRQIEDMDESFSFQQGPKRIVRTKAVALPQAIRKRVRHTVRCYRVELLPVVDLKAPMRNITKTVSVFQDCIEHRRKVTRR